jgi:hypothetical protein
MKIIHVEDLTAAEHKAIEEHSGGHHHSVWFWVDFIDATARTAGRTPPPARRGAAGWKLRCGSGLDENRRTLGRNTTETIVTV